MDAEDAAAQVDTFDNLSDEQFEVFAGMMTKYKDGGKVKAEEDSEAGMHGDMKKKDEKKDDEAKAEEVEDTEAAAEEVEAEVTEASEEVLDTAEVQEEANLSIASEDIETEAVASLRSNLNDWVTQKVLKK
jgi:hypothetical protein